MRRLSRVVLVIGLVTAVVALAACTGGGGASSGGASSGNGTGGGAGGAGAVSIQNFSFDPADIEVKAGAMVKWTNKDSTQHTVTADDQSFNGAVDPGKSFSFTFPKAGTFKYHCSIHPSMVGQVVVK